MPAGATVSVDGPRMRGTAEGVNVRFAAQQEPSCRSSDEGSHDSGAIVSSPNDTQAIPKTNIFGNSQKRSMSINKYFQ